MRRAAVAMLLLVAGGCTTLFDETLLDREDAGSDAALACGALEPPDRPGGIDNPSVSELVYAVRGVQLAGMETWQATGLNLDGFCTETQDGLSECTPPAFDEGGLELIDGVAGIDNAFGRSVPEVELLTTEFGYAEQVNDELDRGIGGLLIIVRRWNGTGVDPRVVVGFATASAVTRAPPLPDGGPPGRELMDGGVRGDPPTPRWDGNDNAWANDDDFIDLSQPLVEDRNAYVERGILVARPRYRLMMDGGPPVPMGPRIEIAGMHLSEPTIIARVSVDGSRLDDVVIAGRWATEDLQAAARSACFGMSRTRLFGTLLSRIADVRSTPGSGGEGVECDALSVGLRFTVSRVELVGTADSQPSLVPLPNFCDGAPPGGDAGPGGTDAGPMDAGPAGMDAGMDAG